MTARLGDDWCGERALQPACWEMEDPPGTHLVVGACGHVPAFAGVGAMFAGEQLDSETPLSQAVLNGCFLSVPPGVACIATLT